MRRLVGHRRLAWPVLVLAGCRSIALIALVLAGVHGCSKKNEPAPQASSASVDASAPSTASIDASGSPSDAVVASSSSPDAGDRAWPSPSTAIVREERDVVVGGVTETWRLEWERPPIPTCMDVSRSTCPCAGWAFGERGDLDLVRVRAGREEDRLRLDPAFEEGEATLPRWPLLAADENRERIELAELAQRKPVRVMTLGDYDHDGHATEMVLQVAAGPCGHAAAVVVGVDARNPKLHVFASREAPSEWITLERRADWESVRAKVPITLNVFTCGDHGAEEHVTLTVDARKDGLHVVKKRERCE